MSPIAAADAPPTTSPRASAALVAYLVLLLVQVTAQAAHWHVAAGLTQVLLMPALAAFFVASAPRPGRLARLTVWALAFSWLGDAVPRLLDGDAAFGAMLGCFLAAQVCYIRAFRPYLGRSVLRARRGWLAPYVVALLGLLTTCVPAAGVLAPAVVIYGSALATMAVLATGVNRLAWVGGALFMVSDGLIALDAFDVWSQPGHDVWVMATYGVGQLLLVLGVLREAVGESRPAAGHHPDVVPT